MDSLGQINKLRKVEKIVDKTAFSIKPAQYFQAVSLITTIRSKKEAKLLRDTLKNISFTRLNELLNLRMKSIRESS